MLHRDDIYRQTHRLGANLIFVNNCIVDWADPYAFNWLILDDPLNFSKVESVLEAYLASNPTIVLDGVVTFDEYGVICAAEIAAKYGLAGGNPQVMRGVKNKYLFRKATASAGIPSPRVLQFKQSELSLGQHDDELTKFTFPCVLKPTSGAGSQFVQKVHSIEELKICGQDSQRAAIESGLIDSWDPMSDDKSADNAFMLEEMIVGQEVDVDILVEQGSVKFLAISDNFPSDGPSNLFMEAGGACPSTLCEKAQEAIEATVLNAIAHYGTSLTGCFHFEVIVSSIPSVESPNTIEYIAYPVELNLRLGGSEVLALILAVYEVHLGVQAMKLACGIPLSPASLPNPAFRDNNSIRKHACSINFLAQDSGYVIASGFLPQATSDPNFAGSMTRVRPGSPLRAPPLAFDFVGWAVVTGSNFTGAMENLQKICSMFFCDIKPFERDDHLSIVPGTDIYYKDYLEKLQPEISWNTSIASWRRVRTFQQVVVEHLFHLRYPEQ